MGLKCVLNLTTTLVVYCARHNDYLPHRFLWRLDCVIT